jgi:hypothetical protein
VTASAKPGPCIRRATFTGHVPVLARPAVTLENRHVSSIHTVARAIASKITTL